MNNRTYSVLGEKGCFYEGEFDGTVCFVPLELIQDGQLNRGRYVSRGWASLNIKAQEPEGGVGSHLFPDLEKPYGDPAGCERMKARIEQLRPEPEIA